MSANAKIIHSVDNFFFRLSIFCHSQWLLAIKPNITNANFLQSAYHVVWLNEITKLFFMNFNCFEHMSKSKKYFLELWVCWLSISYILRFRWRSRSWESRWYFPCKHFHFLAWHFIAHVRLSVRCLTGNVSSCAFVEAKELGMNWINAYEFPSLDVFTTSHDN